ncbi:MAG TPA: acetylglutamate kinase [Polyangia bacterium]|nr:acetylglutamate kinase [Polyangia bacterium]
MSESRLAPVEKASVLVEALPYIQKFRGKTIVVKYGGHAMDDPKLRESFCRDVVLLKLVGLHPVIVHGGGPQIAHMLERLGVQSRFVQGMRITDDETMRVVEMVLAGGVNQDLVSLINVIGREGRAVGLSGHDGAMVVARRIQRIGDDDPGRVGEVVSVDAKIIERLSADGFIPVVAPIAVDIDDGRSLNVNADPFAAKLAAAMRAEKLVLLTDVPGVRGADGHLHSTLTASEVKAMIKAGVISGGMIPKVQFGLDALADGVRKVHILDGRQDHAVLLEVFTDTGVGTELVQE